MRQKPHELNDHWRFFRAAYEFTAGDIHAAELLLGSIQDSNSSPPVVLLRALIAHHLGKEEQECRLFNLLDPESQQYFNVLLEEMEEEEDGRQALYEF